MSIKGRDKEFRCQKVSFLEFNHTEMDRVLTMIFPRLKFNGYASRKPPRAKILKADEFKEEILKGPKYSGDIDLRNYFKGFDLHPDILEKWIETDLLDVVNRGKSNQSVSSLRPLHGETYKFRNSKHCRDYGASEHLYWMLFYARKGKGQAARDALKRFFFPGIDLVTDQYDSKISVDVETQALLRFNQQVESDLRDSKAPQKAEPLCIGQADLLADDILRILTYETYIPRSVLVDYIKTLMAFHLSLYHLKLLNILPKVVKQQSGNALCTTSECPVNTGEIKVLEGCPYKIAIVVDTGDKNNPHMAEMAHSSANRFYRQIPAFVQANYTVKKLDEMAEYLSKKNGKLAIPANGTFSVSNLVELLGSKYTTEREAYFKFRLAHLIEESSNGSDVDPEIDEVASMGLGEFDAFIEILMAYRGKYHKQYITECLDSLLLKNKDTGLLAQARTKGSSRRFVLGSKLLEVLLQLAVLKQEDSCFVTRNLRIEELLVFLYERYGICIDQVPPSYQQGKSILDKRALRLNLEAFKRRLREIGFYEDLSDAYITQKITPRYQIIRSDHNLSNGRQV